MKRWLAVVGAILLGWSSVAALRAAPAADAAEPAATIPLAEIHRGQRGYGLSVFTGTAPARFDVEVLGVLRNVSPDTSYILARLAGEGLETSGVIAGMSGSPVYLDGRLAGAVAFSWPFAEEPIAGITPIAVMRRLLESEGPGAATPQPASGEAPSPVDLVTPMAGERLRRALGRLRPEPLDGATSGVEWVMSGFGRRSRELLATSLGAVATSGQTDAAPGELEPGSSVAGVLVDGDLRLAVTGTVTDRIGQRILAFGHPFLGVGPVRLPMASAEVVTVLASQQNSFKLTNTGPIVGAFDLDRLPGIRGVVGDRAPTIPLRVDVHGTTDRAFDLELAEVPTLSPLLAAISTLGCLESAGRSAGEQSLDLSVRFALGGHDDLELEQSFDGSDAALQAAVFVLTGSAYLFRNPLAEVDIHGIDLDLVQYREPRLVQLIGAHAGKTVVHPGDHVALDVELKAYRGDSYQHRLDLELPTGLPAGRYSLLVGDGRSVDAARLALERVKPVTLEQALRLLGSLHSRRQLTVLGIFGGRGLAVAGEVLPQLPDSLRAIWGAASSGSALPLRATVAQSQAEWMPAPLDGLVRIDLEVRRRKPLAGAETEEEAPAGAGGAKASAPTPAAAPTEAPPPPPPPGGSAQKGGRQR